MTLLEHLEELRIRIIKVIIFFSIAFLSALTFIKPIFQFLTIPIENTIQDKLSFISPTEPFFAYLHAAIFVAFVISMPYILYQLWKYVSPALYRNEKVWLASFIVSGTVLFIGGITFGYTVVFPLAIKFLLNLGTNFTPMVTISNYLKLLITISVGLGIMFQLPIAIVILALARVVSPKTLLKEFRWAVLIIFFISAIITPTTDILNLIIFSTPTLILYLLGTVAAWLLIKDK